MTHKVKYALAKNYHFQPTHITPRLAWMLQRLPNDKKHYIKQGRLLFGLVDSYLIWKFTGSFFLPRYSLFISFNFSIFFKI